MISVPWKVPQAFNSTGEASAVLSSILPVKHFIVVFCQFRQKSGFFIQNASKKGLQRLSWWTIPYVAKP